MTDLIKKKTEELCKLIEELNDDDQKIEALNQVRKQLHATSPLKHHPVDYVEWVKSESVEANDYNPNHVAPPEEKLLLKSISEDGYTMSIVTSPEKEIRRIVDGFHRRQIERTYKKISASTFGRLPITSIRPGKDGLANRIASTIRHNRARGEHEIDGMVKIVKILKHDCDMSDDWIIRNIGMDADELLRLSQLSGLAELFRGKDYSSSWEAQAKSEKGISE
jgi:ParB-like chromosome segregation protein Spo0J